ncbi:related to Oxidoreductase, short-chain dehydrogenase [Phialocephala subalpina]|uniref:Related to Oxidoreductase, short-chain dehydrogenase n=1 Tax=Phialocephala subalpina TaxID=576137 RepID=A0A1L7WKH6_9HELO|nr:related to Oxidoreductase, short-chain dehydrogenase [Phialocephala subalpina]
MGLSQSSPTVTEKTIPDQSGKVFIVTGSTSGVGRELAKILYASNARVYVAARSADKAKTTIEIIKAECPKSNGGLSFLKLELSDLSTIKASAEEFLSKETRLDVLWNNAGVMIPPQGSKTSQDFELQLGTNNLGPFLFTKLLTPLMAKTARLTSLGSVRTVWVASGAVNMSPKGGVDMANLDYKVDKSAWHKYSVTKAGNYLHATEFARRHKEDGIVSVAIDPGMLKTDLWVNTPGWQMAIANFLLHEPIYGAYTELYGGLSPDITLEKTGAWIKPWGKISKIREDLEASSKSEKEGGSGIGAEFWNWSEEQVRPFAGVTKS